MLARVRGNPRPFLLILAAIALLVAFAFVVAPLFNTGGAPAAEIDGVVSGSAVAGRELQLPVEFNNTGAASVNAACVQAKIAGPLRADYALFEGTDREPFHSGIACGGSLSGGAGISVTVVLTPLSAGSAVLSLTPQDGSQVVGTANSGAITISAA